MGSLILRQVLPLFCSVPSGGAWTQPLGRQSMPRGWIMPRDSRGGSAPEGPPKRRAVVVRSNNAEAEGKQGPRLGGAQ